MRHPVLLQKYEPDFRESDSFSWSSETLTCSVGRTSRKFYPGRLDRLLLIPTGISEPVETGLGIEVSGPRTGTHGAALASRLATTRFRTQPTSKTRAGSHILNFCRGHSHFIVFLLQILRCKLSICLQAIRTCSFVFFALQKGIRSWVSITKARSTSIGYCDEAGDMTLFHLSTLAWQFFRVP